LIARFKEITSLKTITLPHLAVSVACTDVSRTNVSARSVPLTTVAKTVSYQKNLGGAIVSRAVFDSLLPLVPFCGCSVVLSPRRMHQKRTTQRKGRRVSYANKSMHFRLAAPVLFPKLFPLLQIIKTHPLAHGLM
jgi:hypothetical protein